MRRHAIPLVLWTLLWALFFFTILAGTEHLPAGDFSGQFHAFGLFQARELAQGQLPTWSPGSHAGVPFVADTQAAVFYPLRAATVLLSLPWGFSYLALELEALLHVWLAGVFTYALGYAITREPLAALVAAVAFALGGYLTSYPLLQLAVLESIAWLPLVLLLLRAGVSRARPVAWLIGAGAALALSALAGHPQTLLHAGYLAAAYYLFLAVRARWSWRWVLGMGALVAAVAVGLWSAALWPTLQYLPHTARSAVSYEFVASGLPLLDYVQTLVPGVLSLWSPEYWGLAAVTLAVLAIVARQQADRAELGFWAMAALLSAWLALGDRGILFELVYRIAPGFSLFQHQERLLGVFSLSCAMLAAQGMALWLGTSPRALAGRVADAPQAACGGQGGLGYALREHCDGPLVRRAVYLVGGSLLLAGVVLAMATGAASWSWASVWARQVALLAVVAVLLWGGRWRRQRAWGLVVLLGLDLYVASLGAGGWQPGPPGAFWPQPKWIEAIAASEPVRIDSGGLFYGNLGQIYGLEDIRGISPLKPRALEDMERLPLVRRWQLLNVAYVFAADPPAGDLPLVKVAEIEEAIEPGTPLNAAVYRFDAALPRAWMSYGPLWVDDRAQALEVLADAAFDPVASVILEGQADGEQITAPAARPEVRVVRLSSTALQIDVTSEAPGFLVISEWCYPGWQARIDGQPTAIRRANYALQAVPVPAGKHTVTLHYASRLARAGMLASLASLLVAGVLAWRWRPAVARRPLPAAKDPPALGAEAQPGPAQAGPWLCALLVLLGFALRIWSLGGQELRGDEAFSYLLARVPLGEVLPALLSQGDPHSPLHYWMLHGWMRLAGDSEFAMRFISFVPGVLLLPLLYCLGKRLEGARLGVLLAGLAAISQSLVWIGQDLRNQYTLVALFSTLAALELMRAIERPAWRRWALYALVSTLTVYSHYYGVFALAAHGLSLLAVAQGRKHLRAWAVSTSVAALAFMPWLLSMWRGLLAAGQLSAPSNPELATHLTAVGTELAVGSALGSQLARWLFLGTLGLCLFGALELWRRARAWAVLLSSWLVMAALGIYLLRFSRVTFNAFYILVASTPWWAFVSVGLRWLWHHRSSRARWLAGLALLVLVGSNGLSLRNYYLDPAYSRSGGYRGVAEEVAARAKPGDIFVRNYPDPCYDYYLRDVPVPRAMEPVTAQATLQDTERSLAELAALNDRLWFVSAQGSVWDPEGTVGHWLEYNTLLEQETQHAPHRLLAYRPLHAANQVMTPLDCSIDGLVRLAGAYATVNGRPADLGSGLVIPAGATVKLTLLWQALAETPVSYTVFTHLVADDGRLLAQHDGIPVFGTSPMWSWKPGQQVLDRHDILVPEGIEAGRAHLLVGVYESQSLARQNWTDGRDVVELASAQLVVRRMQAAPLGSRLALERGD